MNRRAFLAGLAALVVAPKVAPRVRHVYGAPTLIQARAAQDELNRLISQQMEQVSLLCQHFAWPNDPRPCSRFIPHRHS